MSTEKRYDKLVRDKIPEIIRAQGDTPVIKILNTTDYLAALDKKLSEEVTEYLSDCNTEELCDILEVIYAICSARGITLEEIDTRRIRKREKNGAFDMRIWLDKIIKKD